jgi:hypothetical protein
MIWSKIKQIFSKRTDWGLRLLRGFPTQFEVVCSKYLLVWKYLQANIGLYTNICKQILDWMWNLLEFLWIFVQNKYFEATIHE